MADANLQNPIFTDEILAREWLESRVWPNGPVCPHCKATSAQVTRLHGTAHRAGTFQCNACREQFTVTVGTHAGKERDAFFSKNDEPAIPSG